MKKDSVELTKSKIGVRIMQNNIISKVKGQNSSVGSTTNSLVFRNIDSHFIDIVVV